MQFTIRLFSIVPNSAGTKWFFSQLGLIQTKHQNCLHSDKAHKLVLIKADIDCTYGTGQSEQHRHFGSTHEPMVLSDVHVNSQPLSSMNSDASASPAVTAPSSPPLHSFGNNLVQDTLEDSNPEPSDNETEEPTTT